MDVVRTEKREFDQMRLHVEHMLAKGWVISSRFPLTLVRHGQKAVISCGMLIGGLLDR